MTAHRPAVIAVIGGSRGIGLATAQRLQADGQRVVIAARTEDELRESAERLGVGCHPLDASRFDDVDGFVDAVIAEHGHLDGIVNCAGSLLLKPAHLTSEAEYRDTIDQSLTTAFATVRAASRVMMGDGGSIVLVSTAAAQVGLTNHEAIAAAKAGVEGLIRSAAATYASRGIRVNGVAPGLVDTSLTARITKSEPSRKASESMHALGRLGRPEDIASAIAWLLSPEQSWVTGQIIGVDGGLATVRPKAGK